MKRKKTCLRPETGHAGEQSLIYQFDIILIDATVSTIANYELILKSNYDRIDRLVNIIILANGFTVAFFLGLIAIFAQTYSEKTSLQYMEPVYFLITFGAVLELTLWRMYSHYIDTSIVSCYETIIKCEQWFQFSEKIKLKNSLLKEKLWLDRGHTVIDLFALTVAIIASFIYLQIFDKNLIIKVCWTIIGIYIIIIIFTMKCEKISKLLRVIQDCDCKLDFIYWVALMQDIIIIVLILSPLIVSVFTLLFVKEFLLQAGLATAIIFFVILIICIIYDKIGKNTKELIERYPEKNSQELHHAIIIAHKKQKDNHSNNSWGDYIDGIDFLFDHFTKKDNKINYKIYEVYSKEELIPIINNPKTTHLWIFGHGQRNKIKFFGENLCYYDVRTAPKKVFIGQYHCNSFFGKSLADYNNPDFQDVNNWPRLAPLTRFMVKKKLAELGLK